jgi:hypothetical protein
MRRRLFSSLFPVSFSHFMFWGQVSLTRALFATTEEEKKLCIASGKKDDRQVRALRACMWTDIPSRSCALAVEQITGLPTHVFPWEIS